LPRAAAASRSCRAARTAFPRRIPSRRFPTCSGGFTLVEVLLAATIGALLAGALVHVFSGALDLSSTARQGANERRDAQLAVTLLQQDIRGAARIIEVGANELMLLSTAGDTVYYSWSAAGTDTLVRIVGGGTIEPIAAGVDSLGFSLQTVMRPYTTELVLPDTSEAVVKSFSPGDWDDWVAQSECQYESRDDWKIEDNHWCAEEFWPDESFLSLSRVSVRVWAKDHFPAEVDLIVEVYEAQASSPWELGTLLAEGRISRFALTEEPAWHETTLSTVTEQPIVADGHYWLVLHADGLGGHTYAAHVELERIKDCDKDCDVGCWPGTDHTYRENDHAGREGDWKDPSDRKDFFFDLRGLQARQKLTEVTLQIADTLGVVYSLRIGTAEEPERRAGYVALADL
jgi:type II secretory pathway component PulJ